MLVLSQFMEKILIFIKVPQNAFLVFGGIFGFLFVFLVPPIQVYDERVHFFQAYAVSNLDFIQDKHEYNGKYHYGSELPRSVYVAGEVFIANTAGHAETKFDKHLYRVFIKQPLEPSIIESRESGTGYSPVVYIPQAIGITVGKIFNSSPLIMIWLGRFMSLLVWLAVIYLAIKIIPFGKWAMAILALNPMAVFLSASLSADVITTSLSFLFFSLVASAFISTKVLTKKRLITMLAVLALLSLTKPTAVLFGILLFAIPIKRFGKKLTYVLVSIGGIIGSVAIVLIWSHLTADANELTSQAQSVGRVVNPSLQLSGILHDPLHYIKTLFINYVVVPPGYEGDHVLASTVGALGWGETHIPLWTVLLYGVMVFLALLSTLREKVNINKFQKITLISVLIVFIVANITAMYLYFTGVGKDVIVGVQGRYFIPGCVLLIGLFTSKKKLFRMSDEALILILGVGMLIVLGITSIIILLRYYV